MSARKVRLPILRELGEAEAATTCLDNTGITFARARLATAREREFLWPAHAQIILDQEGLAGNPMTCVTTNLEVQEAGSSV